MGKIRCYDYRSLVWKTRSKLEHCFWLSFTLYKLRWRTGCGVKKHSKLHWSWVLIVHQTPPVYYWPILSIMWVPSRNSLSPSPNLGLLVVGIAQVLRAWGRWDWIEELFLSSWSFPSIPFCNQINLGTLNGDVDICQGKWISTIKLKSGIMLVTSSLPGSRERDIAIDIKLTNMAERNKA